MSKKRVKNSKSRPNTKLNETRSSNNNAIQTPNRRRKKKKRRSKISKLLGLIFGAIYSILASLKIVGSNSNSLVAFVALISVMLLTHFATRRDAYEILLGGVPVSVMRMSDNITLESFTALAIATLESNVGTNVLVNEEVEFRPVNSLRRNINTDERSLQIVASEFTYKVEAGLILVDEREIAIVSSVSEAESIYRGIIQPFVNDEVNIVASGFLEDVQILANFVEREDIVSRDVAVGRLTETSQESRVYEVVSGDNLGHIAAISGMTLDELIEYNPGFTPTTIIRVGDQINVSVTVPLLNVFTEEEVIVTETIHYGVETSLNNSEPSSFSQVVQTGVVGQRNNIYHIIRINGIETESRSVGSEIVAHPIDRIIEVGTAS